VRLSLVLEYSFSHFIFSYNKNLKNIFRGVLLVIRIKFEMRLRLRQNKPLHEYFDKIVEQMPNKECLVEVESGRKMTFLEFDQHSNKFANFFQVF